MNREHSVSWADAEHHADRARYKYALPTIDLRCDQALIRPNSDQSRPTPD